MDTQSAKSPCSRNLKKIRMSWHRYDKRYFTFIGVCGWCFTAWYNKEWSGFGVYRSSNYGIRILGLNIWKPGDYREIGTDDIHKA